MASIFWPDVTTCDLVLNYLGLKHLSSLILSSIPDNPSVHNLDVPLELAAAAGSGPPHHGVGDAGRDAALEEDALPRAHPLCRLGIDLNARDLAALHLSAKVRSMYKWHEWTFFTEDYPRKLICIMVQYYQLFDHYGGNSHNIIMSGLVNDRFVIASSWFVID